MNYPARIADLLAIDPGDTLTGVAFFREVDEGKWRCEDAAMIEPDEFNDSFFETLIAREEPRIVVMETFRLYADKSHEQKGSEFLTPQQIGVLKWILRKHNEHAQAHLDAVERHLMTTCEQPGEYCNDPARIHPRPIELVMQPAEKQKPTEGILRTLGVKSTAKRVKATPHGLSAELHGWYHILKTMGHEPG